MLKYFILGLMFFSFTSMTCSSVKQNQAKQGIKGKVLWFEGNQMPGFDKTPDPGKGIAREIHIYEATQHNDGIADGAFYSRLNTRLIAIAKSDKSGKFEITLPVGEYSLLVKEEAGLFANIFDMSNRINPVKVEAGKFTEITISVNYKAAY